MTHWTSFLLFTGLDIKRIERDLMRSACKCSDESGLSCAKKFTVGEIVDVRMQRKRLGYSAEKDLRNIELMQARAMRLATGKATLVISEKTLCLKGYISVSGVAKASGSRYNWHNFFYLATVYRTMKFLDDRGGLNPVGRPKTGLETSARAEWCANWVEHEWIEINAEDCPTGRQYKKVVGMFSKKHVYDQYVKAFSFTSHAVNLDALSLTRFSAILDACMKRLEVAVRQKKNVSGKCEGELIVALVSLNSIDSSNLL